MNIGHAVKVCRASKYLSVETLSNKSGLSKSYISQIEKGKNYSRPNLAGFVGG